MTDQAQSPFIVIGFEGSYIEFHCEREGCNWTSDFLNDYGVGAIEWFHHEMEHMEIERSE